uniref:Ig-like domain-containing protein n=1 Tax=Gopherus evgoodei TaxID=1825980 RepID=A0A8C4Y4J3_9SAUR
MGERGRDELCKDRGQVIPPPLAHSHSSAVAGSNTRGGVCVSPSNSCLCVNAELPAPGPSISVSPSRVIAPGGAVTIRCPCEARRLFLYKDGIEIQELDAAGGGGQFTIPSARREDGGAYTCRSRSTSEPPNWSDPSDIVRIIVVELIYPKPSISLRPSGRVTLGRAVTVQCRGRHQNAMFLLYKDGNLNALQDVELAGNLAEFSFRNVSRRDAGSYSCYYHDKRYQFTWSYPSDPVELVVAGEGPSSVSLLPGMCPWGAGSETRVCAYGEWDLRPGRVPMGGGRWQNLSPGHVSIGGGLSPPCLTPVLLRAGQEFLKPTIWVSPIRVVALGGNVTIRCEGQDLGMEFVLRKAGHPNPQVWTMLPDGTGAELLIPGVGREDGGSYTCNYRSTMEPSRSSYPSDPVEIIVGGEGPGLPAPHPARPTRGLCSDGMLRARLCPDPWAQQRGCLAREWGWSHLGVPQPGGRSSPWRFEAEEGRRLGQLWPSAELGSLRQANVAVAAQHRTAGTGVGCLAGADRGLGLCWGSSGDGGGRLSWGSG